MWREMNFFFFDERSMTLMWSRSFRSIVNTRLIRWIKLEYALGGYLIKFWYNSNLKQFHSNWLRAKSILYIYIKNRKSLSSTQRCQYLCISLLPSIRALSFCWFISKLRDRGAISLELIIKTALTHVYKIERGDDCLIRGVHEDFTFKRERASGIKSLREIKSCDVRYALY